MNNVSCNWACEESGVSIRSTGRSWIGPVDLAGWTGISLFLKRTLAEVVYSESASANSVSPPSERCANTRHKGVQIEEATSDLKDQRKRHTGGYTVTKKASHGVI